MNLPTRGVQYEELGDGPLDHGSPTEVFASPVTVQVYGWGPPGPDRQLSDRRDGIVSDLDLFAPADTVMADRSRVTVNGVRYAVVGRPEDFANGPWLWKSGVRIALQWIEG